MRRRTTFTAVAGATTAVLLSLLAFGDGAETDGAPTRGLRLQPADVAAWAVGSSTPPMERQGERAVDAAQPSKPERHARPTDPPKAADGHRPDKGVGPVDTTSPGAAVKVKMQNFRYCLDDTGAACFAQHQAYVPHPNTGEPLTGIYNPIALIDVRAGATVRFTYEDGPAGSSSPLACDSFWGGPIGVDLGLDPLRCPGHAVVLAAAGPGGMQRFVGFLPRERLHASFTWGVPADAAPGSVFPFFCNVGGVHYRLGMTGGFRVVD